MTSTAFSHPARRMPTMALCATTLLLSVSAPGIGQEAATILDEGLPARIIGSILVDTTPRQKIRIRAIRRDGDHEAYVVNTDENGKYRIDNLSAGTYDLMAMVSPGIHYGCRLRIDSGAEIRQDIEFVSGITTLRGRVQATSYSGVTRCPITVRPIGCEEGAPSFSFQTFSGADGKFEVARMPVGHYLVSTTLRRKAADRATDPRPDGEERPATTRVEIGDEDSVNVLLRTQTGNAALRIHPPRDIATEWALTIVKENAPSVLFANDESFFLNGLGIEDLVTRAVDEGHASRTLSQLPTGRFRVCIRRVDRALPSGLTQTDEVPHITIELTGELITELEFDSTAERIVPRTSPSDGSKQPPVKHPNHRHKD